jgi:hypothetical protein
MRIRKLLAVVAAVACVGIGSCILRQNETDDLPRPDDVEAMRVRVYGPDLPAAKRDWCEVSPEHFASILAAMRPCHKDAEPAKWVVFGETEMTLRGGRHYGIWLYLTYSQTGAFSAGPTYEHRIYYRGGTDEGIRAAIREACGN